MSPEQHQLRIAIAALEGQRAALGDAVVECLLAPARARLAALGETQPAGSKAAAPAQQLRQVTILFLDVVGSTALSQHLDPEEIHAVMDGALARCTKLVEAHHGRVLQYAGDNLLAVFGAGEAREDDAERAVRCGLALLTQGRVLGQEVQRQHGHQGFDLRVGVHTGAVLLGGGVDAEGSIRGIAVNIGARMEQTAPPGAMRISQDTYSHVRGLFDVEPQAPIEVKGVDQPIATYLVRRARPRAFRIPTRGVEGVRTRMVGREAELALLQLAFGRLFTLRRLALVTVVGEAGIGKSRLLHEFDDWAGTRPERFIRFQGRATPQTQSHPYGLLGDMLAWWLQVADDDSPQTARAKFESGIAPLFAADDGADIAQAHAHLLGHLIGLDFTHSRHIRGIRHDPRQLRNRAFHTAAQLFRRVSVGDGTGPPTPVVLRLEDLHWADDASLDFLQHLAQANRDLPLLILGLARPALFERRNDWPGAADLHQRLELRELDHGSSRLLAGELLRRLVTDSHALRDLIVQRAEGNPFCMEELVRMLVDQGTIEAGPGHWTLHADKLVANALPATLTGVLQARLDSLPAPERQALQQASVIGFVFWDQALAALDAQALAELPALVRHELAVARQDAPLDGLKEYCFRHHILHQVTYHTVLRRVRRTAHAQVARWLQGLAGVRANTLLGATAEHFELGGEPTQAAEFFTRAAEYAQDRYAHAECLGFVARALTLMGPVAREPDATAHEALLRRWRLLTVRERTLDLQGRRAEQRADIDALEQLAEALGDDHRRAEVALRRSDLALRTADFQTEEHAARQVIALATRCGDDELRLRGQHRQVLALAYLGDIAAAQDLAQASLAEARTRALRRHQALFLNALTVIAGLQDDLTGNLDLIQQTLPLEREICNRRSEAITLGNFGASWLSLGDLPQAQQHLQDGLRLTRAIGDRAVECAVLANLSQLALWQHDAALAAAHARSASAIAVEVQALDFETFALLRAGNAELALGNFDAAAADLASAHALARKIAHPVQHEVTAALARVALAQGDVAIAMQRVETLLEHLTAGGTLDGTFLPRLIELTCHQALARAGDARAGAMLDHVFADLQAKAATITDGALRRGFLHNIPEHRDIVAAWQAAQPGTAGPA